MTRHVLSIVAGGVVLFVFMALFAPWIIGEPVLNGPWIIISAITAAVAAPLADFLMRWGKRRHKDGSR